jgi:hypothetical protein
MTFVMVVDHNMVVVEEEEDVDEVHYHHYNYFHNFVEKMFDHY